MRSKYRAHPIFEVILLAICLAGFPKGNLHADESSKYLDAVREFADNVLKYGRDTYGKPTPLFVDGLMIRDPNDPNYGKDGVFKPVEWIAPNGERWILSNLASQQNLFRTLDGLTRITGDPKYKQAAMDAIRYAFDNLRSPSGLLHWGGQVAYDLRADEMCTDYYVHELKHHFPYYELMWQVDPEATKQFIESFWSAHILDWSNLEMNRQGDMQRHADNTWDHEYEGGPVFFESRGISFLNAGSDLFYAGTMLYKLSGGREPLVWSKRLAYRYVEARNPETGIAGTRYTRLKIDRAELQFGDDFPGHVVLEATIWPSIPQLRSELSRYYSRSMLLGSFTRPRICQLLLGEMIGPDGQEFALWALQELTAYGNVTYRKEDNSFIPMLTDGTSLEGYVYTKDGYYGPKGTVVESIPAGPITFWVYALAYRVTGEEFMWEMARNIAQGNGLGDIGATPENEPKLKIPTDHFDPYTLLSLLELHKKTEKTEFLQAAQEVGGNLLAKRFHKGFFVPSKEHLYTKFDYFEPLVLLHLDRFVNARSSSPPVIWPSISYFACSHGAHERIADDKLIYSRTKTTDLRILLHEASWDGKIDVVRSLVPRVTDLNVEAPLALRNAAERGHKEIVELLIASGADVNAAREFPKGETPLHSAVRGGHRDIVELLIANGADIKAENRRGITPVDIAASRNRSDLVKLMIEKGDISLHVAVRLGAVDKAKSIVEKGTDINVRDILGKTPLHHAVEGGHKDIVELLLVNGADINAKNNEGQAPVDIAISRNRKEIVELLIAKGADISLHVASRFGDLDVVKSLIEKGADINEKDTSGRTALHYAVEGGHKDVVELLIANGADVNVKDKDGNTPGHVALGETNEAVLDLLIAKGANLDSIHLSAYQGDLDEVTSFIEKGAGVNTIDSYGATPLHYAAVRGDREVVEFLIAKGADVNAKDNSNFTPLHGAVRGWHKDVVALLIDNGANVNARGRWDYTPMYYAVWSWKTEMAELLIEKGADVNAKDRWGQRPLHYAAKIDNRGMARLLIVKGADVNAQDNWGATALSLAMEEGHTEIVELLIKHGAKE